MFEQKKMEQAVTMILEAIGENPFREGLERDPADDFTVLYAEDHEELVLIKNIPFYSMCEHHLLPFLGKVHVGYIPRKGKIAGLSKLAAASNPWPSGPSCMSALPNKLPMPSCSTLRPSGPSWWWRRSICA